jgi:hypothetical protein
MGSVARARREHGGSVGGSAVLGCESIALLTVTRSVPKGPEAHSLDASAWSVVSRWEHPLGGHSQ